MESPVLTRKEGDEALQRILACLNSMYQDDAIGYMRTWDGRGPSPCSESVGREDSSYLKESLSSDPDDCPFEMLVIDGGNTAGDSWKCAYLVRGRHFIFVEESEFLPVSLNMYQETDVELFNASAFFIYPQTVDRGVQFLSEKAQKLLESIQANQSESTPVQWATIFGSTKGIDGCDRLGILLSGSNPPWQIATYAENTESLRYLTKFSHLPQARKDILGALTISASRQSKQTFEALLDSCSNVELLPNDKTPLDHAIGNAWPQGISMALDAGFRLGGWAAEKRMTHLQWFVHNHAKLDANLNRLETINILAGLLGGVNDAPANELSPLIIAAQQGSPAFCQRLIDLGADVYWKDKSGSMASNFAEAFGHSEVVALLKSHEAKNRLHEFLGANKKGNTP